MSNGTAALQLVAPDPPSTPPAAPEGSRIEIEIGTATADAAVVLSAAMLQFHANGRMTPETKEAGAEKIARLAQLELDTLGEINNFSEIARKEGLRQLRKFLDADPDFRQRHGGRAGDVTLTGIIDGVLEITSKVVALEKTLRAN